MSSLVSSSRKTGPPRSVSKQIFRVPHPGLPVRMRTDVALASEYGQLGEPEVSHNAVRELLAIRLDRAVVAREESGIPPYERAPEGDSSTNRFPFGMSI